VHATARASQNDSRAEACAIARHAHALLPRERAMSAPSSVANTRLHPEAATDRRATAAKRREPTVVERLALCAECRNACARVGGCATHQYRKRVQASAKWSRTKVSARFQRRDRPVSETGVRLVSASCHRRERRVPGSGVRRLSSRWPCPAQCPVTCPAVVRCPVPGHPRLAASHATRHKSHEISTACATTGGWHTPCNCTLT
jgi:hypothetical protein